MPIQRLCDFLDHSPTAWHACALLKEQLLGAGFQELDEKERWHIAAGKSYFVIRNQGSLIAFHMPHKPPESAAVLAAHTDSPGLKLKPQGEFSAEGASLLNFEVYGSPILASWIGRDLTLSGRVFYQNGSGEVLSQLVSLPELSLIIPHLAIHLDARVNESGLLLNKQEHITALAATSIEEKQLDSLLDNLLKSKLGADTIIYKELFATPQEQARRLGLQQELLASARLDNLAHVVSATEAFLAQKPHTGGLLKAVVFWNHEEVGSTTSEGAASSFFEDVFHRIALASGLETDAYYALKARSICFSCDVAHAVHPNYPEKHDPRHKPHLGKGIALKTNAQERYISNSPLTARVIAQWQQRKLPYQFFVSRNDMPCGTTIGPIHASRTGLQTIDMGIPLLGMHAAREVIHVQDYLDSIKALEVVWE
ncbi:MAG: M18 family aminopeptidase [Verrucomicrobia bacterium]|nr:M18 family aminopeptidase [Verrucomicrobiota bacterium]